MVILSPLQANAAQYRPLNEDRFWSIIPSLLSIITETLDAMQSELLTATLNKPQAKNIKTNGQTDKYS